MMFLANGHDGASSEPGVEGLLAAGRGMKHKRAIFALLRLYAEIGGKLLDNRTQAERLAQDMKHVEAVIRMFEPGFDVTKIAARRRYSVNPIFRRGGGASGRRSKFYAPLASP